MKTKILFLGLLLSFTLGFGQISVYYSKSEDVYGYSVSATNNNWSRDTSAENECKSKGGQNCRQIVSRNGYGCYAIVKGSDQNGGHFIGAAAGNYAVDNAINDAKYHAKSYGAEEQSLYLVHQGCISAPTEENNQHQNNTNSTTPQWSDWKKINSTDCDLGIEYSIKKEVRYQMNYQLWFYYKVRNTSNKNIKFEFSLTSKGKNQFAHPHILSPGGEDKFMHKMSKDYIDGIAAVNVINTKTNKSVCDDGMEENDKELIDEINTYLYQIDDNNPTKKAIKERVSNAQNNKSLSNSNYINLLKTERGNAKKLLESLGKTVSEKESSNDLQELWAKQISLVKEIKAIEPNAQVEVYEGNISDKTDHRIQKTKENISYLENYLERIKTDANSERGAREREAQEKQEKYNSQISQGDAAMQSEDYAGAMNHYQNAQSYAATETERSTAQQKYNQALEAKKAAERKIRVAEQNKRDETENVTYAATSAATITAMSLLEDATSEGFTSGKIYMGLGIEQIPLISNNTSQYHTNKSYIEAPLIPGFDMGIIFGIANNKKVSLYLNPKLSYGISAFSAGTSGGLFEYGGTAMIRGNWDREFPLKIFVEGGYFKRSATFHYDADASAADSSVSTSTDDVRDGEYNYSVIRYGGGLVFHQIDDDEEYTVKGGVFFDKPSFFPKDIKSNIGFNLQGIYNKLGSLEVYYSPNYFIGGNVLYPSTLEKENKAYFGIKFTRTGKLW